jgi:hypothetical protein
MSNNEVKRPKCGSTQLTPQQKGFRLGQAIGGNLLLGPAGLLARFVRSKEIRITCLRCGFSWEPGPKKPKCLRSVLRSR